MSGKTIAPNFSFCIGVNIGEVITVNLYFYLQFKKLDKIISSCESGIAKNSLFFKNISCELSFSMYTVILFYTCILTEDWSTVESNMSQMVPIIPEHSLNYILRVYISAPKECYAEVDILMKVKIMCLSV